MGTERIVPRRVQLPEALPKSETDNIDAEEGLSAFSTQAWRVFAWKAGSRSPRITIRHDAHPLRESAKGWEMGDPDQNPTNVPPEEQAFSLSPTPSPKVPAKQAVRAALPRFVTLDVDTVRIDSRVEKCLRESGIDRLFAPSAGVQTEDALVELAKQEPIHVVRRNGDWWCVAGEPLLADARRIMTPPRFLPVAVREDPGKSSLRTIVVVEQMIRPARNQMHNTALKARVPMLLRCAESMPELFAQKLRDDQWAGILRRSLRWFASAKKRTTNKKGGRDGE